MKKNFSLLTFLLGITISASAQNVGIGTTLPIMNLHVSGGDSAVALFENKQALNANVSNSIYFKTGSGSFPYTGAIKTIGESNSAARLGLFTYTSTSPNQLLERLSISDDGNTGIGTINPLARLHVAKADSAVALFENTQALNTNVSTAIYFKTGKGSLPYTGAIKTIGESNNLARLSLFTFTSVSGNSLKERMSITDAGKVGIGITTPQTSLHINPNGAGSILVGTNRASGGYTNLELGISSQSDGYGYIQATKASGSSYGNLILNANGGNVGVGTTTPQATMDIHGGIALPIKVVTSNYTVQNGDYTIIVNMKKTNAYDLSIYLPPAATNAGRIIKLVADSLANLGYGPYNLVSKKGSVYIYDATGQISYGSLYYTHAFDSHLNASNDRVNTDFSSSCWRITLQCTGGASGRWYTTDTDFHSDEDIYWPNY